MFDLYESYGTSIAKSWTTPLRRTIAYVFAVARCKYEVELITISIIKGDHH
jgi:hypothetical protein